MGEADQLFTIFTERFGKLEVLGKGIRKISSKLKSGTELFYLSEIEFIQGKIYKTLTDAILIDKFENLRKDLEKLKIAYSVSGILDNLIKGQEPDEKIWELLLEVFSKLDNLKFKIYDLRLIYYYFLWNLISILGYAPQVINCAICQKRLTPVSLYFSPREGGILCQNCSKKISPILPITSEVVKILRIILDKNWGILSRIKVQNVHLDSLEEISKQYIDFLTEKKNDKIFHKS